MSMDNINNAADAMNDLAAAYHGKIADIDGRVNAKLAEMDQARADLPSHMDVTIFWDPANGDDGNDGLTEASAVATLSKAVSKVPGSGIGLIYLYGESNLFQFGTTRIYPNADATIRLASHAASHVHPTKRELHMGLWDYGGGGSFDKETGGFFVREGLPSLFAFKDMEIHFPADPQDGSSILASGHYGLIGCSSSHSRPSMAASFTNVDFINPANPVGMIMTADSGPASLYLDGCTYDAAAMAGRWISGAAITDSHVSTNLSAL